jgi:hypothetical protein
VKITKYLCDLLLLGIKQRIAMNLEALDSSQKDASFEPK